MEAPQIQLSLVSQEEKKNNADDESDQWNVSLKDADERLSINSYLSDSPIKENTLYIQSMPLNDARTFEIKHLS